MRTKKKNVSIASKAKELRNYGIAVSYGTKTKRGKVRKSPQLAAAVTRAYKKIKKYVEGTKQTFVFQKAKGSDLTAIARGINSEAVTPGGFFLRVPKGAKKMPKYTVRKDGTIFYRATGPKGGRLIEEIHPIDPKLLAEDPPRAILALAKKGERVILTVNGFNSSKTKTYTIDALAFYTAQDLLPKFLDPNVADEIEPGYNKMHNQKRVHRSIEDFVDTFHVKIIRHEKPAKKTRKGKRRNRR